MLQQLMKKEEHYQYLEGKKEKGKLYYNLKK